ncbi:uncharacterized protein LOC135260429 [Anguilla rostrata]|uniref:uncharacterized protein LOC135260429 n=1 Tax=Anguilla rostrata TaxID=7938 RepID=UPI0030CA70D0
MAGWIDSRDVKTEDLRRRASAEFEHPNMSELRIVLLGKSGELRSTVGNIILGAEVLSVKDQCERARGLVNGKRVALINTPDLLDPKLPEGKLIHQIERCVTLSAPGPHAFLLVLENDNITSAGKKRFERILHSFSPEAFMYSMVLTTQGSKRTRFHLSYTQVLQMCSGRCYKFHNTDETNYTQVTELMEKIEQMVGENEGGFLSCEMFKEPESSTVGVSQVPLRKAEQKVERKEKPRALSKQRQEIKEKKVAGGDRLNLVLFGRRGAGKTFAGNTILGRRESSVGPGSSSVCERREGEVCGRPVTVVEMPALCDAQLTASAVSRLFTSLCGHGVHAFLLVTPAPPLTDEDKAEITRIQETFGSRVTDYMIVIFIHENPAAQPDILQQSKDIQELLRICGNRYFVFYNQHILNNPAVPRLLQVIEEIKRKTRSCFSLDMYWEAQLKRKVRELEARHKTELEEKDRKIRELEERIKGTSQGDVKTEASRGRTSPDFDRPNMSELRVVLLGKSGELRSKVGNIILGAEVLSVKDECERARGLVNGKRVALINTPDLLDPELPEGKLLNQIERCVTLSAPGPHAFLLVLENGNITSEGKKRFERILRSFSPEAFKYSMVLTTQESESTLFDQSYTQVLQMCSGRCYTFHNTDETNYTQVTELMEKIEQMVGENGGGFLSCEMFKEPESARLGASQVPLRKAEQKVERKEKPRALSEELQEIKGKKVAGGDRLNLVLFGRREAGKTFAGNTILGRRESSVGPSSSSVCERRDGEVDGRPVTVVEMPALCDAQLTASAVSHLFTSLCDHGVHAFLLVTPAALLTDVDKAEITRIQETFGSRVTDYMMVIFTHENPAAPPVHDFLQQSKDIQELLKICGNRHFVFYNQHILNNPFPTTTVPMLLEVIEKMNRKTGSCFSLDMYWEAQLERKGQELEARYKMELEEKDRKIRELEEHIKGTSQGAGGKDQSSDCVRIVLVGKTGNGKSATGNTILQREEFQSRSSMKSVTTCCKKGVGEVAGRRVAVVDTPGLFDTSFSNEKVQQEIAKCISFLAPGPNVFLLVLQIGRITEEEKDTLQHIKSTFGKMAEMFTIVIFTRGDDLRNESIESFIQQGDPVIQNLIQDCGNRFHVFNNNDMNNRTQVYELLDKIDVMVQRNGGGCYTNEMFQEAESTIRKEYERIMSEKEEEMQREKEMLEAKHEAEMKEMRRKMEEQRHKAEEKIMLQEKKLKDKEEHLRMELKEWKKKETKKKERRDREDIERKAGQESEWKSKIGEIEEMKRKPEEELKDEGKEEERERKEREKRRADGKTKKRKKEIEGCLCLEWRITELERRTSVLHQIKEDEELLDSSGDHGTMAGEELDSAIPCPGVAAEQAEDLGSS